MCRVLGLSLLLAASPAFAQAPGEVAPAPYQPTYVAPVVAPPPGIDPLAKRWAISLSLAGTSVEPDDAPQGSETTFSGGELAIRYRASRRFELFANFGGGRQVVEDMEGDLAMSNVLLGARYRFLPTQKWNWFLMAGFGGMVIAPRTSTEEEREGLSRGVGMFGLGVERRWSQFALQAELRAMGIGPRENVQGDVMDDELSGSTFTFGVNYYF